MVLVLFWGKKGIGLSSVWFKLVFVWFGSSRRLLLSSVYILTSSFCQSINVYLIIIRGYKYVKDKIQNLLFISGDCGHVDYTVLYSILAQFFFKLISCSSRMSLFFKYWTEINKSYTTAKTGFGYSCKISCCERCKWEFRCLKKSTFDPALQLWSFTCLPFCLFLPSLWCPCLNADLKKCKTKKKEISQQQTKRHVDVWIP